MISSQSGGVKFRNIIIVIEAGKNKYTTEKMQGAGIKMYLISKRLDVSKMKEVKEGKVGRCRCYIIGDQKFCEMVSGEIRPKNLKWELITRYKTEDEVMKAENVTFLKKVSEGVKEVKKTEFEESIDAIFESDDKTDEEKKLIPDDIAAVLMALDDMEGMKIFPVTNENIYSVFLKTVKDYIQDENMAKTAVDFYLKWLKKNK